MGDNDHRAQREWEHFQVQKGVERFRRTLTRTNKNGEVVERGLEETTPGQRIATELIGPMVEAVRLRQEEFAAQCRDPKTKRLSIGPTMLSLLPAETLAACAVLTALANPVNASYTSVRINCAQRVRHELEYQEWKKAEAAAEKQRKADGEDGINLFKMMLKYNDVIDKRVVTKWSKKAAKYVEQSWTQDEKIHVGTELMELLISLDGWFKVDLTYQDGRKKLIFGMTDAALAATSDLAAQCELQRPFLAPMICAPLDYVYIDDAINSFQEDLNEDD